MGAFSGAKKRLQADRQLPVLVFEQVAGHKMPVVTNLFATKEHLALALDTTPERVIERFGDAQVNRIAPRVVSSGAVKDVILTGDRADLGVLPAVTHCEKDGGPYLTAGMTIVRDPRFR